MSPDGRHREVITIGASAGGVEALRVLVADLPPDLAAAVLIVLHVPRVGPSALPAILSRAGPLPVSNATDGLIPELGHIYVAPADTHLLLLEGRLRLSRGPMENGHRPAIDPLFRSAARRYGPAVIGVVLSGSRDDGAAGLLAIAENGGAAVVQDPQDALHPSMPRAALDLVPDAHVRATTSLGPLLAALVREQLAVPTRISAGRPAAAAGPADPATRADQLSNGHDTGSVVDRTVPGDNASERVIDEAEDQIADMVDVEPETIPVQPAGFGCPSCGGSLFEVANKPLPRYRCRVGHAWSARSLLEEQAQSMEGALWMALRALEEKAELSRRMAHARSSVAGRGLAARYEAEAEDAERAGSLLRELIKTIDVAGLNSTASAD